MQEQKDRQIFPQPRCVLLPKGGGPRTVYAADPQDPEGPLIHILVAPNGKTGLVCPDCGTELVARQGEIRQASFAHYRRGDCEHAGETAVHRLAKEIIEARQGLWLPELTVHTEDGPERIFSAQEQDFDEVFVERWEEGLRPDLIGVVRTKSGEARRLIIEIRVTHAVDRAKRRELRSRDESVLEIDLSQVDRELDEEDLAVLILKEAPRSWLHHKKGARLQAQAYERMARARAERERRRDYAIAAREKRDAARQSAAATPPSRKREDLEPWLSQELRRWALLDVEDILTLVPARDGVFDVPAEAWRCKVLEPFAPWSASDGNPVATKDRASETPWVKMRVLKWIKPAFEGMETEYLGGTPLPRDFAREACRELLDGISKLVGIWPKDPRRDQQLKAYFAKKWSSVAGDRDEVLAFARALDTAGVELWSPYRDLRLEDQVEGYLGDLKRRQTPFERSRLRNMRSLVETGCPSILTVDIEHYMRRDNLQLVRKRDEERSARRILEDIAEMHRRERRRALDERMKRELEEVRNSFAPLILRWPELQDLVGNVTRLLDEEDLSDVIEVDVDMSARDPDAGAMRQVEDVLKPFRALAEDLLAAESLANSFATDALQDQVFLRLARAACRSQAPVLILRHDAARREVLEMFKMLVGKTGRFGYGQDFAIRALEAVPRGSRMALLDLMIAGEVVAYRKAMAEVRTLGAPPAWVQQAV